MTRQPSPVLLLSYCIALLCACNSRLAVLDPPIDSNAGDGGLSLPPMDAGPSEPVNPLPEGDCQDAFKNGNETDVDCGGACPACAIGATCGGHPDCESQLCRAGSCQVTACEDGAQNGDEVGVDCGGSCESEGRYCPEELTACSCASSANLVGIACGAGLDPDARALVTANGGVVVFSVSPRSAYRWSAEAGSERLATGSALPIDMSDDGSVTLFDGVPPFLSRADGTRTDLPLEGVTALSDDGRLVLGGLNAFPSGSASLWTVETGAEPITDGDPAVTYRASFMNPDGSVVGGRRTDASGNVQLFRWDTSNGAPQSLGPLPSWAAAARNDGVTFSRDGSAIAGFVSTNQEPTPVNELNQIFRWTAASGIVILAPLWPSGATGDRTTDSRLWLNDDGSVLVGTFDLVSETRGPEPSAFRWTEATGAVALASEAGQQSIVRDASGDLGVVVGYTREEEQPFVWNAADGFRDLASVLSAAAVDLEGWTLSKPSALSRDGRVVVGEGTCNGVPAVYRVVLPD